MTGPTRIARFAGIKHAAGATQIKRIATAKNVGTSIWKQACRTDSDSRNTGEQMLA
jgi:hypothetical protein